MSKRQVLAPVIDNAEYRNLLAECYGGHGFKKRFAVESGYSQQTISSWWGDRSEAPKIVILFLRDRAALTKTALSAGKQPKTGE